MGALTPTHLTLPRKKALGAQSEMSEVPPIIRKVKVAEVEITPHPITTLPKEVRSQTKESRYSTIATLDFSEKT